MTNRRNFLKQTSAISCLSFLGSTSQARSDSSENSDEMKSFVDMVDSESSQIATRFEATQISENEVRIDFVNYKDEVIDSKVVRC